MEYFKYFDFISSVPKLYVDQNKRFKNKIGGFMTIITFFIIIIIFIIFLFDLINRTKIYIIQNQEIIKTPKYNLTNSTIAFQIYDEFGFGISIDKRIFSINIKKYDLDRVINNGLFKNKVNITTIEFKDFSQISYLKKNEDFRDFFDDSIVSKYYFFDLSAETFLEGKMGESHKQIYLSINIEKCVNTTKNQNICLSKEIIDKNLYNSKIKLYFPDIYLNHNDKENPAKSLIKSDVIPFNSQSLKVNYYFFEEIEYITDNAFIFQDIQSKSYIKQELIKNENFLINNFYEEQNLVLKIIFTMSINKTIYLRSYQKFHTFVVNLYAISKIIIHIIEFLLNIFIDNLYLNFICNYNNLFQKFEINLLNKNIVKKKIFKKGKNNILDVKPGDLINDLNNNFDNIGSQNPKILNIFKGNIKENHKNNNENVRNFNIKVNKLKIKSKRFSDAGSKNKDNNNFLNQMHDFDKNPIILKKQSNKDSLNKMDEIINENNEQNNLSNLQNENIIINQNINKITVDQNLRNLNNYVNITNLALLSKNFNSTSKIFKKSYNVFNLTFFDIFKKYFLFCKSIRVKVFNLGVDYLTKKLSVEEILRKIMEIDKLKFLTIDKEILDKFNKIGGPNLFFFSNARMMDLNNYIYSKNLIFDVDYVDEMWNRYEFKEAFNKNGKRNKNLFKVSDDLIID